MANNPEILEAYLSLNASAEDQLLAELSRETHLKVQMPQMLSGHIQGLFLEMFSRLLQPSLILEIGTFTGYSAICLARGLAPAGKLITLDINEELEPIFSRYFLKARLNEKIEFIQGDATKSILNIQGPFDLVFIDADKMNYSKYYDLVIDKVRPGGYILSDNVLWSGRVLEPIKDRETQALFDFNNKLKKDPRTQNFIISIRDGINICRKLF